MPSSVSGSLVSFKAVFFFLVVIATFYSSSIKCDLIISSTSASSSIKSLYCIVDADFFLRISVSPVNLYVFVFFAKFSLSFSS
jgi:hypothetical protein